MTVLVQNGYCLVEVGAASPIKLCTHTKFKGPNCQVNINNDVSVYRQNNVHMHAYIYIYIYIYTYLVDIYI